MNDYCNGKDTAKLYGRTQREFYQPAKKWEIQAVELWGLRDFRTVTPVIPASEHRCDLDAAIKGLEKIRARAIHPDYSQEKKIHGTTG